MVTLIKVGPLTRIEGHLDIEVSVEPGSGVVSARCSGTMFRGFERILQGRDPRDAPHYTQRICGVCPIAHGMTASLTLESAFGITPVDNGRILRNLILGANFLQSHVLHFYHLALLDYVDATAPCPCRPWKPAVVAPDMLTGSTASRPDEPLRPGADHSPAGAPDGGGLRRPACPARRCSCRAAVRRRSRRPRSASSAALLGQVTPFINNICCPTWSCWPARFPRYSKIGRGCGNLLAFGVFDLDAAGGDKTAAARPVDRRGTGSRSIRRRSPSTCAVPTMPRRMVTAIPSQGTTTPRVDKAGAYSWIKVAALLCGRSTKRGRWPGCG